MKYVVLVIILVCLVAGGGGIFWYVRAAKAAAEATSAPATAKVEKGDLRVSITATGAVASNQDVDIKCQASGVVDQLPYTDVSAHVPPGALLMHLNEKDEQPAVDLANAVVAGDESKLREANQNYQIAQQNLKTTEERDNASLVSTKASMEDAKNKARRTDELFTQKLASQEDLETANTLAATAESAYKTAQIAIEELDQARAAIQTKKEEITQMEQQLAQDKSRAATAATNLSYCKLYAPVALDPKDPPDWYISAMGTTGTNLNIGYLVQSGSSGFSGGTTVMTLSDLSHIFVLATVDESDIGHVAEGQEALITADSYRGVQFKGKVVRIATRGVNTSNVVTFEVKVEVTSKNRMMLKPMMTANVEIVSAQKKNAVIVPMLAISRKHAEATDDEPAADDSSASQPATQTRPAILHSATFPGIARVDKPGGAVETRQVRVGIDDGVNYEVISGLEPGETVELNKIGADSKFSGGGKAKRPGS